jgi:hypothetical protein
VAVLLSEDQMTAKKRLCGFRFGRRLCVSLKYSHAMGQDTAQDEKEQDCSSSLLRFRKIRS